MAGSLVNVGQLTAFVATMIVVTLAYDTETSPAPLSGEHVCTRQVWESGYRWESEPYTCFEEKELPLDECEGIGSKWHYDHHHDHYRRRFTRYRRTGPGSYDTEVICVENVKSICYQSVWVCYNELVKKTYCCKGYEEDNTGGCKKEIECKMNNGDCDHQCHRDYNTGSYCSCMDGYKLVDHTQCKDIDECAENNGGCQHICHNEAGSRYCECREGFRMTSPTACQPSVRCDISNGGCEQTCENTASGVRCGCRDGYELMDDKFCDDVDECADLEATGCSHLCLNQEGGYMCACPRDQMMMIGKDNKTCVAMPDNAGVSGSEQHQDDEGGLSVGAIVGIVLGCIVFLALLVLVVCLAICLRRHLVSEPPTNSGISNQVYQVPVGLLGKKGVEDTSVVVEATAKDQPPPYDTQHQGHTNMAYDNVYGNVKQQPPLTEYDNAGAIYDNVNRPTEGETIYANAN